MNVPFHKRHTFIENLRTATSKIFMSIGIFLTNRSFKLAEERKKEKKKKEKIEIKKRRDKDRRGGRESFPFNHTKILIGTTYVITS